MFTVREWFGQGLEHVIIKKDRMPRNVTQDLAINFWFENLRYFLSLPLYAYRCTWKWSAQMFKLPIQIRDTFTY